MCAQSLNRVRLFAIPWTAGRQAPLSMEFTRQEHWGGLPFSPSGDLSHPGTEPESPASPALAGRFFTTEPPGKPMSNTILIQFFLMITCFILRILCLKEVELREFNESSPRYLDTMGFPTSPSSTTRVPGKGLCSHYLCRQHLQAGPGKTCSVSSSLHQPQSIPPKCISLP